ncbi:MAG: hypothetical protein HN929_06465 [Chloroflexi bacterium]|jgi:hypothetical protein|nr:hypothetical protein [Chloroflexota bacterium]MBT7081094.1 hypothetical protein [Chloroflexota bacterium]MBT7289470.1 hypothetical protein [Chloroflexota bacterium]
MNGSRSHLETISTVLKMECDNEITALKQFGIVPEEYSHYRRYLLSNDLARTAIENEHPTLKPTQGGMALLSIANRIEDINANPKPITLTITNVEKKETMQTSHNKTKNANAIHEKLMRLYVVEDAEVTRLEVQSNENYSDDGEVEIAEHTQRRDILHKMLRAVQHMTQ